jgi:hypothetical protein
MPYTKSKLNTSGDPGTHWMLAPLSSTSLVFFDIHQQSNAEHSLVASGINWNGGVRNPESTHVVTE